MNPPVNPSPYAFDLRGTAELVVDEIAGLLLGGAFTMVLFLGMAQAENLGQPREEADIEDLRTYAMPFEPPPPLPSVAPPREGTETLRPLSGIELEASDSPVSIAVVPRDLEALLGSSVTAPKARAQFNALYTDLKPSMELEVDVARIYQESEVDQKPRALVRAMPPIPSDLRGSSSAMRVVLLLLIDTQGRVESTRLVESSGKARLDEIIARTVREEWLFSPGIRRGKKVRVLAQQPFRVSFAASWSPFSVTP